MASKKTSNRATSLRKTRLFHPAIPTKGTAYYREVGKLNALFEKKIFKNKQLSQKKLQKIYHFALKNPRLFFRHISSWKLAKAAGRTNYDFARQLKSIHKNSAAWESYFEGLKFSDLK